MTVPGRHDGNDSAVEIAADLAAVGVELDMDVLEISADEWAIHGRLAYEGQVIAATFESAEDAWRVLAAAAISPLS
jgi:hypothetical protein